MLQKTSDYTTASQWIFAFLICFTCCAIIFPRGYLPGDLGDMRLVMYFLEHGYLWVTGVEKDFWSAGFFYPDTSNVMALSDNMLGGLPLYAIFRWLGLNREVATYAWIVGVSALNFIAAFWVLQKWRNSFWGAIAGAYIFTFSLPMIAQLGHLQLSPRFMVPCAFYFLIKFLQSYRLKDFSLMLACVSYQIYLGIYLGYFLIILMGMTCLANLINTEWKTFFLQKIDIHFWRKKEYYKFFSVLILFFVVLLPLAIPYVHAVKTVGTRGWYEVYNLSPHWQSYLLPDPASWLWKWMGFFGDNFQVPSEQRLFIGILPMLTLCCAIYPLKIYRQNLAQNPAGLMLWVVGFCVMFTLCFYNFTYYKILYNYFPGASAIRAVARIILVLLFPIAAVFADVLSRIFKLEITPIRKTCLTVILLGLMIVDQGTTFAGFPITESTQRVEKIKQLFGSDKTKVLWVNYVSNPSDPLTLAAAHVDAMLAAQDLGVPTINGYSGHTPANYPVPLYWLRPGVCSVWNNWRRKEGPLSKSVVYVGTVC